MHVIGLLVFLHSQPGHEFSSPAGNVLPALAGNLHLTPAKVKPLLDEAVKHREVTGAKVDGAYQRVVLTEKGLVRVKEVLGTLGGASGDKPDTNDASPVAAEAGDKSKHDEAPAEGKDTPRPVISVPHRLFGQLLRGAFDMREQLGEIEGKLSNGYTVPLDHQVQAEGVVAWLVRGEDLLAALDACLVVDEA